MPNVDLIESTEKTRKRLFEAGEMKLLVLHFISQQPKFSYDIIKDIANLVGGNYKPSTGTICPTINYLEEQQYTQVQITADERKQYHVTQKGLDHLLQQQELLNKALSRFYARHQIQTNPDYVEIKNAMEQLKIALRQHIQNPQLRSNTIVEIAVQIQHAAHKIQQLGEEKSSS